MDSGSSSSSGSGSGSGSSSRGKNRRGLPDPQDNQEPKRSRRGLPTRTGQPDHQTGEEAEVLKYRLCFSDEFDPTVFINYGIVTKYGEPMKVYLRNATYSNSIIRRGPLSTALIEFVVLDSAFCSNQQPGVELHWSPSQFNENIVPEREGRKPLMAGEDTLLKLKRGIGTIRSLRFNENSSWTESKMFRLGARIIDEEILANYSRIKEAVSEPFRVVDEIPLFSDNK